MKGAYGLKIISTSGREYYTAENAIASNSAALKGASADAFYEHIGAKSSSQGSPNKSNRSMDDASSAKRGCGVCANCTKEACGKCARCLSRTRDASQRCFQKVSIAFSTSLSNYGRALTLISPPFD